MTALHQEIVNVTRTDLIHLTVADVLGYLVDKDLDATVSVVSFDNGKLASIWVEEE